MQARAPPSVSLGCISGRDPSYQVMNLMKMIGVFLVWLLLLEIEKINMQIETRSSQDIQIDILNCENRSIFNHTLVCQVRA